MIKFTKDSFVDIDKYSDRLNEYGYIFVDKQKLIVSAEIARVKQLSSSMLAETIMRVNSGGQYNNLFSSKMVYEYLIDIEHCPQSFLRANNAQGYSLDASRKLKPLRDKGFAAEFLDAYLAYKTYKARNNKLSKLCDRLVETTGKSIDGSVLYHLDFTATEQVNQRFNYNNYDIITIPKTDNNAIAAENGYILAWGDFPQSDLNFAYNLLIKEEYNSKIMSKCKDKYEGIGRILADFYKEEFDYEQFLKERPIYKQNTLATVYGAKSDFNEQSDKFIKKFGKYLNHCPRYAEFKSRLEDAYMLGNSITVTSYFGHPEISLVGNRSKEEIVNFCLNSPMQSSTSAIMILTVNSILDKFYELGYTSEDIRVYYCRHDEPIFYMKASVMKDAWVFKEFNQILVDNWNPIELNFEFGIRYKQNDKSLQKYYENICELNEDKITIIEPSSSSEVDYMPTPQVLKYFVGIYKTLNGYSVVCLYNDKLKATTNWRIDSQNDEEIAAIIMNKIREKVPSIKDSGYSGVLLVNRSFEFEDFYDRMYIRARKDSSAKVSQAEILAMYAISKRDKESVDPVEIASLIQSNPWVTQIGGGKRDI